MKSKGTAITAVLVGGISMPILAHADINLYGLIDTSVRFTTHEDANGNSKVQQQDGILSGSRWGILGKEELGKNYQAIFVLENGFATDTGQSLQGARMFGRQAFVGLQGDFGTVTLGRQYTVIHQLIAGYDVFALANLPQVGFQAVQYTGGARQDNMIKYSAIFGGLSVAAQHAFGEAPGSLARSSSSGASLTYASGPFKLGGAIRSCTI